MLVDLHLQYAQNIIDSQFLKDYLGKMEKQDETIVLVADGAYNGTENQYWQKKRLLTLSPQAL